MNIDEILRQYNVEAKHVGEHEHARAGWLQVDCPKCSPKSGRFRLGINLHYVYANCWNCGPVNLASVLHQLTGQSYFKCKKWISGFTRFHLRPEATSSKGELVVPSVVGDLKPPHRAYLRKRGFKPDHIKALWGVRGIGPSAKYGWRIWIPIQYRGQVVAWTSRAISNAVSPKYLTAKPTQCAMNLRQLLYGIDYARQTIIVCEGPIDAWRIGPGAVATLGLGFSSAQVELMRKYPRRVICFDSTPDAQRRAKALAQRLKITGETHVVELETGKDAAEASEQEIAEFRQAFLE